MRNLIAARTAMIQLRSASSFFSSGVRALLLSGGATAFFVQRSYIPTSAAKLLSATMSTGASPTCTFQIAQFPCLSDNYGYLIHDVASGHTAAIDTPDAQAYQAELDRRGWTLTHIFNTHHHYDHTGGNMELKQQSAVQVFGPESEKIPGRDVGLVGGSTVKFGSTQATIIDVGGHTKGHIAYYFENDGTVFVGDSLFSLGCGKMFEGTPDQFWASLKRLRSLPDETVVYWYVSETNECLCISFVGLILLLTFSHSHNSTTFSAHEYTMSNAKFAKSVEPNNAELITRIQGIEQLRQANKPTVPSILAEEKRTNPFLRCDISDEIRQNVGVVAGDSEATAFAKVRKAKDMFR